MALSARIDELSKQLIRPEDRLITLQSLLRYAARGHDVSQAAERVVRHCLFSPSGTTPRLLALSIDILTANPGHSFWVDTLSVLTETLRRSGSSAALVAFLKIPTLPHTARQHLALHATTTIVNTLASDPSTIARRAAAQAAASLALCTPPLTAPSTDTINLTALTDLHLSSVRNAVERLVHALLTAALAEDDSLAVYALSVLCAHIHRADAIVRPILLDSTVLASARCVATVLVLSLPQLSNRFKPLFSSAAGKPRRLTRDVTKAFARIAAHVLAHPILDKPETSSTPTDGYAKAAAWAVRWVDSSLTKLLTVNDTELSTCAASALLVVCGAAVDVPTPEKVAGWGTAAVKSIIQHLESSDGKIPAVVCSTSMTTAVNGLAALSKNDFVTGKFVVSAGVGLLPFAAACTSQEQRLHAMSVIASTVVEYDLSGRDTGMGTSLKAVLASKAWKTIMSSSESDSSNASELVCCFAQSLLDASKKICKCADFNLRLSLTQTWAVMLSNLMVNSAPCLKWPASSASSYARDMYLKLFDALGQYSSFLMRAQGVGMEEYERVQQHLVKACVDQNEVGTRAALLTCITRYWMTSGMKAESNAGHILKAVWKHIQEHYRDEEIFLTELKTGALWSETKKGLRTRAERDTEGGYISMATAISKRTGAVVGSVATTVSTAVEQTLFGSVAFSSAAGEGSTLTTDLIYSGLSPLLALVSRAPAFADKAILVLKKYILLMDATESADFIAVEAVRNTMAALHMYRDEFFPKPVAVRIIDPAKSSEHDDHLAWMQGISESCIFAASRLEDPAKEIEAVGTEEHVLDAAASAGKRIQPFTRRTTQISPVEKPTMTQGDQQLLHGASDPFSVVGSHSMDTVKGLALLQIEVINRTPLRASNVRLTFSSSGALVPVVDAPTSYSLGTLDQGMSFRQNMTLSVQRNQGFAGRVFISLQTQRDGTAPGTFQEQSCIPYYIPSSDVLLLRRPSANAAMDVFRRRWDLMRHSLSMHVPIRNDQSVDMWIDALERRSKCLRLVGRMRTYSHVCALVADSSRGDYVAIAAIAPEANGPSGSGPCMLYVTIRSNSNGYNLAFREECRDWLQPLFRVILLDEEVSEEDKNLALRPQDAFFVTQSPDNASPYQRWRNAHATRMRY